MAAKCIQLGRFEAVKNGIPMKYQVQTVTPDLIDRVLELMVSHFLSREPITLYDQFLHDPVPLNLIKDIWRKTMEAGASLVALEETEDESVNIIGANMTVVTKKDDEEFEDFGNEKVNKLLAALHYVTDKGNIFEKYQIDKYLTAYGLTVHPKYHGYQVGYRLLQCRKPLCEAIGLTASGTVFTAQISQHIAKKVGFVTLSEQVYKTFKYQGEIAYPNLDGDMKFMGIKYA